MVHRNAEFTVASTSTLFYAFSRHYQVSLTIVSMFFLQTRCAAGDSGGDSGGGGGGGGGTSHGDLLHWDVLVIYSAGCLDFMFCQTCKFEKIFLHVCLRLRVCM